MASESPIKRLLPKSLLGRSLLIIVTPLVILQLVSAGIFYQTHWEKVALKLARGVAGDVASVIEMMHLFPGDDNLVWIRHVAHARMNMIIRLRPNDILPNKPPVANGIDERMLVRALQDYLRRPFQIDTHSMEDDVIISVQLAHGVLEVIMPRKRLFTSTTYVFVLWMVGTSMILFGVAVIFMRNQVKPIRRLAYAADSFGKGRDSPQFKPEGATEVRQAAAAFVAMRDRIRRQITQRTDMLAGVSHDLRTPLTRMRLQCALLGEQDGVEELQKDIDEMEHMLEGYLAFARGEGAEAPVLTDLTAMLDEVVLLARRKGGAVDLHTEGQLTVPLRPDAFRRCLTNLLDNAMRYAKQVSVRAGRRGTSIEITVDDDGPGIPEESREEVFKPFFRLEGSRNPGTGGVGLGLSIARDVARGHGGEIILDESPSGGLRAKLSLPL